MLQLWLFISRRASQSNNSGWDGGSDWEPMSSRVDTIPLPNICSQTRLTRVRAVSGFSLLTSHLERPSLFLGHSGRQGFRLPGVPGATVSPFISQLPRSNSWVVRSIKGGFSTMLGTVGAPELSSSRKVSPKGPLSIGPSPEISGRNAIQEI